MRAALPDTAVERELAYWSRLGALPAEPLPFEPWEPAPGTAGSGGLAASSRTASAQLDEEETRALLTEVPAAYGTQINDALLAALAATLAPPGGALWVDLEGHGREEILPGVDLSRTVGWFTSLFPLALVVDHAATGSPGPLLRSIKEQLRAVPERGLGYGLLRHLRGGEPAALLAALPRPSVSFNYLGEFDGTFGDGAMWAPADEPSGPAQSPRQRRTHALAVNAVVLSGRLRIDWRYSADLHDRAVVERLVATYASRLRELIAHCRTAEAGYTPSDFPQAGLGEEELENLLAELEEATE